MMKTKLLMIFFLILLNTIPDYGQTTKITPLHIGDKMPDETFHTVINYSKPSFKTQDFKHKLLILDFWATWCHWCIAAFPKEDSLSVQFKDKLHFMLVDAKIWDNENKVKGFYEKTLSAHKDFSLPSVYLDTVLVKQFPNQLIPHYVWIRNGIIVAITGAEEITAGNIEMVLNGKEVNLKEKTM